jgi:hypothetical protein
MIRARVLVPVRVGGATRASAVAPQRKQMSALSTISVPHCMQITFAAYNFVKRHNTCASRLQWLSASKKIFGPTRILSRPRHDLLRGVARGNPPSTWRRCNPY